MADEREALVSLMAWSVGLDRPDLVERFVTIQPDEALRLLASLTRNRTRESPRLVLLERLARIASRRGEELLAIAADPLRELFSALVEAVPEDTEGLPPSPILGELPPVDDPVEALMTAFERVAADAPAVAYAGFAVNATAPLALRAHESEFEAPRCDDSEETDPEGGLAGRTVAATFFSRLEFDKFESWLDPEAWPSLCSWFFDKMIPVRPKQNLPLGGWNAVHDEVVLLDPATPWTTCLFFFGSAATQTELRTTYRLATPKDGEPGDGVADHFSPGPGPDHTLHVIVDNGVLIAQEWTVAGPDIKSKLSLSKTVAFTDDDLDDWVTVLCDTFWLDLAIGMADKAAHEAVN
jgi:hypothetical protein